GGQDPTFDGVYRQSLALLALAAAGTAPAPTAGTWLLTQQCADGGVRGFRARLPNPSPPPESAGFLGAGVTSTGLAAPALHGRRPGGSAVRSPPTAAGPTARTARRATRRTGTRPRSDCPRTSPSAGRHRPAVPVVPRRTTRSSACRSAAPAPSPTAARSPSAG